MATTQHKCVGWHQFVSVMIGIVIAVVVACFVLVQAHESRTHAGAVPRKEFEAHKAAMTKSTDAVIKSVDRNSDKLDHIIDRLGMP